MTMRWARGLAAFALLFPFVQLATACDSENACSGVCPTGKRYTNSGTCVCAPFDAGYCSGKADCPDVYCPASGTPDACGGGQQWSTTICGCYPLPSEG